MKNGKLLMFVMAMMWAMIRVVGAVPLNVDFSEWSGAATALNRQVDLDSVSAHDWFYENSGLTFSSVYMYWDGRGPGNHLGVANDTPDMPGYMGQTGYVYFVDTTDFVTVDWQTISSQDIYLDVFDSDDHVLGSFYQEGSDTLVGTTTLFGTGIAYLTFHDNGGQVGLSSLSYDYDSVTDGLNQDIAPVPEPATMFLLGVGMLGFGGFSRLRKNQLNKS